MSTGSDDFGGPTSLTHLPALSHPQSRLPDGAYPKTHPSSGTRSVGNTEKHLQSLQGFAAVRPLPNGL